MKKSILLIATFGIFVACSEKKEEINIEELPYSSWFPAIDDSLEKIINKCDTLTQLNFFIAEYEYQVNKGKVLQSENFKKNIPKHLKSDFDMYSEWISHSIPSNEEHLLHLKTMLDSIQKN